MSPSGPSPRGIRSPGGKFNPSGVKLTYLGFEINATTSPTTGENIIEMKKDHSSPMLRYLPSFSDTTSEKIYQAVNMAVNQ
jgi:hypothetical protein